MHLRSGKRNASVDKCCPSKAPSAGAVWTVCSCSPWRELLFCHRTLFSPTTDKGTYYVFCLKQKNQRLDVFCICCQQNLCQVMWRVSNWLLLHLMGNICKNSFCINTSSDHYLKCSLKRFMHIKFSSSNDFNFSTIMNSQLKLMFHFHLHKQNSSLLMKS